MRREKINRSKYLIQTHGDSDKSLGINWKTSSGSKKRYTRFNNFNSGNGDTC